MALLAGSFLLSALVIAIVFPELRGLAIGITLGTVSSVLVWESFLWAVDRIRSDK